MKQQLTALWESCISNSMTMRQQVAADLFGDDVPPTERVITRRFSQEDAAKLVGVSRASLQRAEKDGRIAAPDLSPAGGRLGYTIYQLDAIRQVFGTAPWQSRAVTVAVASNKGGSYKTSVAVHLSQWLALQGYRVLLVDTDPQGTAGDYFGYSSRWVDTGSTIAQWMFGQADSLDYAIHPTCWPRLDIIPASQELQRIDRELDKLDLPYPPHLMLRAGLDGLTDRYDAIIIDGAPNLADGTIAQVFAADVMLCPTPAELHDTASTEQFFQLLHGITAHLPDDQIWAVPDVRILVTKVSSVPTSSSKVLADKIRVCWGGLVLDSQVKVTEEVGKAQMRLRTVFEQDREQRSSPAAWKGACAMWEAVFTEVMDKLIKPRWGKQDE